LSAKRSLTNEEEKTNTTTALKQKATFLVKLLVLGGKERLLKTFLIEFNCRIFSLVTFFLSTGFGDHVFVSLFRRLRHHSRGGLTLSLSL
jgi:hypothetical protein